MLSVIFTAECGTVLLSLGLLITLRKLNIAKANPVFRCLVPLVATFNVLRIPKSGKFLLAESAIREAFESEE